MVSVSDEQKKAIECPLGPTLVIAGAGTGKTTTLTQRFIFLHRSLNIPTERILAITFTNKAANEMRQRIIGHGLQAPFVKTIHSLCLLILRSDIDKLNRPLNFDVIDEDDKKTIFNDIFRTMNIDKNIIKPAKAMECVGKLKCLIDDQMTIDQKIETLRNNLDLHSADQINYVKKIYAKYESNLILLNKLDFDDLLILTYRLLNEFQEVVDKWKNQFAYVMVDEFQDTDWVQFQIINFLVSNKNIFVVGDPDQTIYTWRGAYSDIFNDFTTIYSNYKQYVLTNNYRSTQKILDVANTLIKHNHDRVKKSLYAAIDHGDEKSIDYYCAYSEPNEADYVATTISELVKNQTARYEDIAILYRSKFVSASFESALLTRGIPYRLYGGVRFYERMEIKDIIAYLKLMTYDNDDISFKRVVNVPSRGVGLTTKNMLADLAASQNTTIIQLIKSDQSFENPSAINKCREFLNFIEKLKKDTLGLNVPQTIEYVIQQIKYEQYLNTFDESEDRKTNLIEFMNLATQLAKDHQEYSLADFMNEISLYTTSDERSYDKKQGVALMTVHNAKGAEFPVVFLVAMKEGVSPSSKCLDLEEERRIVYVAITRAMERLYISTNRGWTYMTKDAKPSRFIDELMCKQIHIVFNKSKPSFNMPQYKETVFEEDNIIDKLAIGRTIVHPVYGKGLIIGESGSFIDVLFSEPFGREKILKSSRSIKLVK